MSLRLYNTRTRRTEPFVPYDGRNVRIYVCGLTPSAEAHLGHARSFLFFDVLRRYLTHLDYRVTYVQNVTDVDDRSINAAKALGIPWSEVVERYFQSFKRSMNRLGVLDPDREPRATQYIPQIVAMIGALIERGHAYAVGDGVYFSVSSFARYGALSGRNTDELLIGARIAPGEEKRDPLDFALWKLAKPGEPSWPAPWGAGRPGWHIECSAMSHALLGEPFDIHGGGFDLIFPHHENEIAQSESLAPAPMANVWMHGGLLQFDGRKMSKSLGNFEPLSELLERQDPQAIRLLFLQIGYRKPLNFTESSIESATTGLRRLQTAYDALRAVRHPAAADAAAEAEVVEPFARRFFAALDDDMNTSGAVSVLFDLAASAQRLIGAGVASRAAGFMHEALTLLGISPSNRTKASHTMGSVESSAVPEGASLVVREPLNAAEIVTPELVGRLRALVGGDVIGNGASHTNPVTSVILARYEAKQKKDFAEADRLRDALREVGIVLADSKEGATWSVGA
jgi:cysteinyl-tRNA synthetase